MQLLQLSQLQLQYLQYKLEQKLQAEQVGRSATCCAAAGRTLEVHACMLAGKQACICRLNWESP